MEMNQQAVLITEHQAILAQPIRHTLGTNKPLQLTAKGLVQMFVKEYEREFGEILPVSRKTATTYMRRALTACGNDSGLLQAIIQFVIQKWPQVKDELQLDPKPNLGLFGHAALFQRIRSLYAEGFAPGAVKHRFVADDSPDYGWGDASKSPSESEDNSPDVGW